MSTNYSISGTIYFSQVPYVLCTSRMRYKLFDPFRHYKLENCR